MINLLVSFINVVFNLIVLIVIVDTILAYFLNPYNTVRNALDRILLPFLAPIRKVVPMVGMFDLSPVILIILVEILKSAIITFLFAL